MIRLSVLIFCCAGALAAQSARELFVRAVADFQAGRIRDAVAGFDRLASEAPHVVPELWQRGIALYYAGRFQDCRRQFEAHRMVNPNDVENAAWHFLCVARAQSFAAASKALLPVGADSRVPMREIYEMYRSAMTPEQVLAAAGEKAESQFYAHLYVGLFHEAKGDRAKAAKHIALAAEDRYSVGGYMHTVARVHRDRLASR